MKCSNDKCVDGVIVLCSECAKKMYPNKGKFTMDQIRKSGEVKAQFDREHMWVRVIDVSKYSVSGVLCNQPILPTTLKFGSLVVIPLKDVEDIKKVK